MLYPFQVPVKPHVRKYLVYHLTTGYKLTSTDPFGRCLRMLLQQPREKKAWDGFTGRYTALFAVAVDGNQLLQKRLRVLSSKSVIDFNNFVESVIKAEFHSFVDNRKMFGLSQYSSIQQFRAKYDFQDEDISHDTLKKSWQRQVPHHPVSVRPA